MTSAQTQARRRNAARARRVKWINAATNRALRLDGQDDAMAELARRESPTYYAKDDPRRAHWESGDHERLMLS